MTQPNVLFILTDQQAISTVSCYTEGVCRTPHADALAADGVRFDRCYTPIALCTPARASILTGQYPHDHGAMFNSNTHAPFDERFIGSRGLHTYAETLRHAGYRLGYVGKWHAGIGHTAEDLGFEGFNLPGYGHPDECEAYDQWLADKGATRPEKIGEWNAEGDPSIIGNGFGYRTGTIETSPEQFVADQAIDLIDQYAVDQAPFFINCNFWGPHAPYLPTADYAGMYDPDTIEPWPNFEDDLCDKPLVHRKYRDALFPNAARTPWSTWARAVARYFELATMIDVQVGRLIDRLKAHGLYENTLIIFTSDHGETCGVHGGAFDKGAMAYEEMYRVPMIVKAPAGLGGGASGAVREQLVSLLDLAPTFADAAGTTMPGQPRGRSLLPLVRDPRAEWRDGLMSEFHGHRLLLGQRIYWRGRYKYVFNFADVDELYDLTQDPAELNNRIWDTELADVANDMRQRLKHELEATGDRPGPEWRCFFDNAPSQPPAARWRW